MLKLSAGCVEKWQKKNNRKRRRRIASAFHRKLTGTAWQCSKINSNSMESSITMFYICFLIRQVKVTMKSSINSWAAATALFLALLQCLFCSTPDLLSYEERYSVYKLSDWEQQRNRDFFDALLEERENLAFLLNTEEGRRRLALEEDLRRLDQFNTPTIRRIIELERAVMDVQGGYYRTLDSGDFRRYVAEGSSTGSSSSDLNLATGSVTTTTTDISRDVLPMGESTPSFGEDDASWNSQPYSNDIVFQQQVEVERGLLRFDQFYTYTIRRIEEHNAQMSRSLGRYYRSLDSGDFRRYSSVTGGSSDLATVSTTISRDELIAGGVSTSGELTTTNPWADIEASSGIPFEPVLHLRGGGDGNDAASPMQGKSTGAIQWNFTCTH